MSMLQGLINYQAKKEFTLLASAERTVETTSADQVTPYSSGVAIFLNVSSVTATPGLTLNVEMKDSVSGNYKIIWTAGAAVTTTGQYVYILHPAAKDGNATEVDGIPIPKTWRLKVTVADADSATYSVSYSTLN